jgi:hypothetical protein
MVNRRVSARSRTSRPSGGSIGRARGVRGIAATIAILVATWPQAIAAAEPPKYGRTQLGPVYLTFGVNLTAGVDDNVYNSATSAVSDESVTLMPTVEGVVPLTRRARIKAMGGVAPYYFSTERNQRHTDRLGSLGGELDLGPLSLSASHGVGRFRQRFTLEIDERIAREERSMIFGATLRIRRMSAGASRRVMRSTYEPGTEATTVDLLLDRETTTHRFDLALPLTRRTTLAPSVDLVRDDFLHEVVGLSPTVDSERYRLALEFSKAFISGRIAGGLQRFGAGQGVEPYSGPFLEVNAGMPFFLKTRLVIDARRDVSYTSTPAAQPLRRNTGVNSLYGGELQFGLPWNLYARASTTYSKLKYLSPTVVDGQEVDRNDRAWKHGGALLRRFGAYLGLGVTAYRTDRTSVIDGRSYRAWTYGLTGEFRY